MVRSSSGDIDILVLFILHQFEGKNVFIDNGVGKNRKIIYISMAMLSSQQWHALAGVYAFSGNDYISSFFWKGEKKMWSLVLKNEWFLQVFLEFGLFSNTTDDAISILEDLCAVCVEIQRLKKLTNWEWSIEPDSTETEKILIWLVYHHVTATCVSISIELVMSQICFMNQDVWWCC